MTIEEAVSSWSDLTRISQYIGSFILDVLYCAAGSDLGLETASCFILMFSCSINELLSTILFSPYAIGSEKTFSSAKDKKIVYFESCLTIFNRNTIIPVTYLTIHV